MYAFFFSGSGWNPENPKGKIYRRNLQKSTTFFLPCSSYFADPKQGSGNVYFCRSFFVFMGLRPSALYTRFVESEFLTCLFTRGHAEDCDTTGPRAHFPFFHPQNFASGILQSESYANFSSWRCESQCEFLSESRCEFLRSAVAFLGRFK